MVKKGGRTEFQVGIKSPVRKTVICSLLSGNVLWLAKRFINRYFYALKYVHKYL